LGKTIVCPEGETNLACEFAIEDIEDCTISGDEREGEELTTT